MRRLAGWLVVLALATGCATATAPPIVIRAPSDAEVAVLRQAVRPLLEELNFPWPRQPDDCRIRLQIMPTQAINAGVGAGTETPCTFFTVAVSEGALKRLSVDMLRAILAHELGHVRLGHFDARRARAATPAVLARTFDRAQEAEADRFAVDLLRKLEPRYPGACIAMVYVLALLGEQPGGAGRWLATHPSPDDRAETTRAGCEGRDPSKS